MTTTSSQAATAALPTVSRKNEIEELMSEPLQRILTRIQLGLSLLPAESEEVPEWTRRVRGLYSSTTGSAQSDAVWQNRAFKAWREDTRRIAVALVAQLVGSYGPTKTLSEGPRGDQPGKPEAFDLSEDALGSYTGTESDTWSGSH